MNKLITVTAAFVLFVISGTGNSQADLATDKTPQSLESEYQRELDKWMLQAYEGDRDAQFKVGVLFTNDEFQTADLEQSAYWYKQAARQGHALAQYNLGHLYLTGNGTKRSETEAMKWWLKAAEQDHPLAQFNVGRAYYLGIGLNEDHSQSRLWFERAAKNSEPKSIDILEQLGWSKAGEYKSVAERDALQQQAAKQTSLPSQEFEPIAEDTVAKNSASEDPASENTVIKDSSADIATSSAGDAPTSEPTVTNEAKNPIAVYTNPAKRSVLIAILDIRKQLDIVSATPEWTEVSSENGFPVWVHRDYIVVSDDIGSIQGNAVNARSVPLITNGTIVGRLNDNETLVVLDKKEQWYRVMSPSRFTAWVKTDEFNRKEPEPVAQVEQSTEISEEKNVAPTATSSNNSDDNDWLFNQDAETYTLQLASFDDPAKITEFKSRRKFLNNPNLHSFTSESKDITWTYFLYGSFDSSDDAKQARVDIKQKLAWVRSFGKLQQNRCVSWKKQIPTPKELNQYCS